MTPGIYEIENGEHLKRLDGARFPKMITLRARPANAHSGPYTEMLISVTRRSVSPAIHSGLVTFEGVEAGRRVQLQLYTTYQSRCYLHYL